MLHLPASASPESKTKSYLTGEGLTAEEWQKDQNEKQRKHRENHERQLAEAKEAREVEHQVRQIPSPDPVLEAMRPIRNAAASMNEMPIQDNPQPTADQIPPGGVMINGQIFVPARGPQVDASGKYIGDGDVPVSRGKVKPKGKVAAAREKAKTRSHKRAIHLG